MTLLIYQYFSFSPIHFASVTRREQTKTKMYNRKDETLPTVAMTQSPSLTKHFPTATGQLKTLKFSSYHGYPMVSYFSFNINLQLNLSLNMLLTWRFQLKPRFLVKDQARKRISFKTIVGEHDIRPLKHTRKMGAFCIRAPVQKLRRMEFIFQIAFIK